MGFEQVLEIILNNGMATAIIIYFLYKDYKFNGQIINTLGAIEKVLARLETWHSGEDKKEE